VTHAFGNIVGVVGSIPSPSNGTLEIGPLKIHAYGLMIALGVVAGVWLMGRRFEAKGIGTRDDANAISLWAVLAGVVGSRLYHVATDWSKFSGNLENIPKIWEGGLGIPGGLIGGIGAGAWLIHRRGIPIARAMDCAAPALALAQAIGRWGNYFNQELFGKPTTLPWGLEIDADKAIDGAGNRYPTDTLFHPTFLYESLANLLLCGVLLWIDRRFRVRPGQLLAAYVMGYGIIRFFVEGLRIDEAHHVGGLRWNQWVALAAVAGGIAYLVISNRRPPLVAVPVHGDADRDTDTAVDPDDRNADDGDADGPAGEEDGVAEAAEVEESADLLGIDENPDVDDPSDPDEQRSTGLPSGA
jgi:prolipoprotein diacylglyceryl transferase